MQLQPELQLKAQPYPLPITKQKVNIDPRYHILQARSTSASHTFIYGVRSTKIYCLPTCTARLARRANVVFFNTVQEARRDGFRPCQRCRPDDGGFRGRAEEIVGRVITLATKREGEDKMWNGKTESKGVSHLAREVGVSPSYLSRVFKRVMGVTVGEYLVGFEQGASESMGIGRTCARRSEYSPVRSVEGNREDVQKAADFADFDLDDWFWTGEYLNDSGDVQQTL